jgi:hypothetical protein
MLRWPGSDLPTGEDLYNIAHLGEKEKRKRNKKKIGAGRA